MAVTDDDRRFLGQLNRLSRPTVHTLCEAAGVTATAVRHRLTRLEEMGLVEREAERAGRGRPTYLYKLTRDGRSTLGDDSERLAKMLWDQVMHMPAGPGREQLLDGLRSAMADDYADGIDAETPQQRLAALADKLRGRGLDVDVTFDTETGQLPVLQEHCCPYGGVADAETADGGRAAICELEEQVFSAVVGATVKITQHCGDGHACCEFSVVTDGDELAVEGGKEVV